MENTLKMAEQMLELATTLDETLEAFIRSSESNPETNKIILRVTAHAGRTIDALEELVATVKTPAI